MTISRAWFRILFFGLPLLLADLGTSVAQEVLWRVDYAAARKEAQEKNLPLVMDFGTSNCLWCKKLAAVTFRDPEVIALLNERFIPLKVDAERESRLTAALKIQSFPTLVFAGPDGVILGQHEGFVDANRFRQQLRRAQTECAAAPIQPSPTSDAKSAPSGLDQPVFRTTAAPIDPTLAGPERARLARELLARAEEDYSGQQLLGCLERCALVTARYADLPEAQTARRLAAKVKSDPALAQKACETLVTQLGEFYLELAENQLRQQQPQQAALYFERIVQVCPGSAVAQSAQSRLASLQQALASRPNSMSKVRAQSP